MTIELAADILKRTETELRQLIAAAAQGGNYEILPRLAALASDLAALERKTRVPDERGPHGGAGRRAGINRGATRKDRLPVRKRRTRRGTPPGYPKFLRRGDNLVKVGWSRRDKREYQHAAPWAVLLCVADVLAKSGSPAEVFTTENLMSHLVHNNRNDVPSYQVYVCLGWFRDRGLVRQHGRQGYSVAEPERLCETVRAEWKVLTAE
jgi:hypothetical protein